jgi:carboxyl-terminal processing protease
MRAILVASTLVLAGAVRLPAQAPPLSSLDTAWAAISRTYFDTALVNGPWRALHDSLRTALGPEPEVEPVRRAIRTLIAFPRQSHFVLIPADAVPTGAKPKSAGGGPGTTGIDVRMIGDTLVAWRVAAGSPAATAGVRPGDIITHLDTLAFATVVARLAKALPNDGRQVRMLATQFAMSQLGGTAGDTARLTVRGDAEARQVMLVRTPLSGRITQYGNLPPLAVRASHDSVTVRTATRALHVPVVHFSSWFPVIIQDLDRALFAVRGAPALILDLRGNPGGVVGMIGGVAGHFTDTVVSLGTMYGRGSTLRLRTNPRVVDNAGQRTTVISAPVAILVDEFSASSTEFFAAGMQGLGRARIFGTPSAGQSLPAAMLRLPSGDVLMHPIADHEDAVGRRVEGVGVAPDTPTPLTRSDLRAGRDAAMDAARAWLARTLP